MKKIIPEEQYQVVSKSLDLAVKMLQSSGYPLIDRKYFLDTVSREKDVGLCLSCRTIFAKGKHNEDYCPLCSMDKIRGKKK